MKVNVEKKKLQKLFALVLIAFILVLLSVYCIAPMFEKKEVDEQEKEGVSTIGSYFQASKYEKEKMIQDYMNPTDTEKSTVNATYGAGNWYFNDEGLHVTLPYGTDKNRLFTDVWPENEKTQDILKPDMEILEIELGETFIKIKVCDVKEKDINKYIKEIQKEYKNELNTVTLNSIFRAYSEENKEVNIEYSEDREEAVIKYIF